MFLDKLKKQLSHNQPLFIGEDTAFRSAVTIPLVLINKEWHVLFEVRSATMRRQPGDISFPGGRIDATDSTLWAAAVRETYEELGVKPETVELVHPLSPYVASPTFVVYPFVVVIEEDEIIKGYNEQEVEETFTVPLEWLLDYEPSMHLITAELKTSPGFPYDKIVDGADYQWRNRVTEQWFFEYKGYTIWGLTARILKHFIESVKEVEWFTSETEKRI